MKQNLGTSDRLARIAAALGLLTCAFLAPLPALVRGGVFGVMGGYLLLTALAGTCLGYTLMGKSTCPTRPRSSA